jgi:predicted HTH transcriptional regulator
LLANELNAFLEGITETTDDAIDMDLMEMIQAGENSEVEFKTTLRYDMRENIVNKKLEEVILKTIAAFSNGSGGTLILGVEDDLNIIGLENDYKTLRNGTKDEFELHLRNLINKAYGVEFATNNLEIEFPIIQETEICVINISAGLKPLYTEVSDKNGGKSKKFYVRSGNSSQQVDITEVASYINQRFN